MSPLFSTVIAWADRDQLETSLARNRAVFERHGVEIVIVNGGGNPERLRLAIRAAGVLGVRAVDLPGATFNKSACLNVGALVSTGEFLFLLDADIVLVSDVFTEALDDLRSGSRFVAIRRIVESKPPPQETSGFMSFVAEIVETRELVTKDGRRAVLRTRTSSGGARAGDGLVLVRSEHMRGVGGLNSRLTGYGYEDTDFQIRLQLMLGLERVEHGDTIHLSHTSAWRDVRSWRRNMSIGTQQYCRGDYLGSFDHDTRQWRNTLTDLVV